MSATVQEIMNGNHLWNDGMKKGNTICPWPFHGGGIKSNVNTVIGVIAIFFSLYILNNFSVAW
jgi:hypothetical protein